MKTLEQLKTYPGGDNCNFLDRRDKRRLLAFFPASEWKDFGFSLKDGATQDTVEPYNRDNVLEKLKEDLAFAFEKAEGRRGISACLMADVIKMWMWVLDDDELSNPGDWEDYGIAYLTQVAIKYDLPVSIRP